jgi:hypothetical protein
MGPSQRGSSEGRGGPPHHATVVAWLALFIALGGVASGLPGNNTVSTGDIKPNAVRSADIKNSNVKGVDVRREAIASPEIANGAITTDDLAPEAVGTAAIANGSVAPADQASIPAARVDTPQQAPGCTPQVIESGPSETMQLSGEQFDTADMHAGPDSQCSAGGQSRLTAPHPGVYLVSATVTWPTNEQNRRFLRLTLDDGNAVTPIARDSRQAVSGVGTEQTVTTLVSMDVGDYVQAEVAQDSGSDLTLSSAFGNHLSMAWVGPS